MCIIAVQPPKLELRQEVLDNCWAGNDDGAGFAYAKDGNIIVIKELENKEKFETLYRSHRAKSPNAVFVLHWRVRTHGKVNRTNIHPFFVNKDVVMFHNGTISDMPHSEDYSDSYLFAKTVLSGLPHKFYSNETILRMIHKWASPSRIALLTSSGKVFFTSMNGWEKDGDFFFSNNGWKGWIYRTGRKGRQVFESPYTYNEQTQLWEDNSKKKITTIGLPAESENTRNGGNATQVRGNNRVKKLNIINGIGQQTKYIMDPVCLFCGHGCQEGEEVIEQREAVVCARCLQDAAVVVDAVVKKVGNI